MAQDLVHLHGDVRDVLGDGLDPLHEAGPGGRPKCGKPGLSGAARPGGLPSRAVASKQGQRGHRAPAPTGPHPATNGAAHVTPDGRGRSCRRQARPHGGRSSQGAPFEGLGSITPGTPGGGSPFPGQGQLLPLSSQRVQLMIK